ncbi:MAG: sulfotransferase [Geminicoccaceae bacterium]|nr:sulfotransferase [Geminicoccaceae bacterium]
MTTPNFFIIGAPKSGTTSLLAYLMQHPDVFVPGIWEMNFLSDDLHWRTIPPCCSMDDYLRRFEPGAGKQRIGEKSVFYLYSRRAAGRIRTINRDARLICILRDPVEVAWSFYKYNLANLEEDLVPFERALEAEADRRRGRRLPARLNFVENLLYREVPRYAEQLERLYRVFPEDQVLVLRFDDLRADEDGVFQTVLDFLDLKPFALERYRAHNQSDGLATIGVRRFLSRHPRIDRSLRAMVPQPLIGGVRRAVERARGGGPAALRAMRPETRALLCETFEPEVRALERLTGLDLAHWCRIEQPARA